MENTHSNESSGSSIRSDVFALVAVLGMAAKSASDDVLDTIDSNRQLNPAITYTVYEQFYFLGLHVSLRLAFDIAGPSGRDLVQDLLSPRHLFMQIPIYLNARYKPKKLSEVFLKELKDQFLERLNRSELEYSKELEYADMELADSGILRIRENMQDILAQRLAAALFHSGVEIDHTFVVLVKQVLNRRIGNILPIYALTDAIITNSQ